MKAFAARCLVSMVAIMAIVGIFAATASATAHQDHTGACGTVTHSIKKTIRDWQFLGVQGKIAASLGIHGQDGPIGYQLNQHLVIGKIRGTVTTGNNECNGGGTLGSAGSKTLPNLEGVILKPPPGIGKEACKHPNGKCKKVASKVPNVVFPISCKNPNEKKWIPVWIWVRKTRKVKPKKPHEPKQHGHTVIIHKTTLDQNGNTVKTPMHIFQWRVTAPGYKPKVVVMNHNSQFVGTYRSGTCVTTEELHPLGTDKYEVVSKRRVTKCVGRGWLKIQYVNKERKKEESPPEGPNICSGNVVINGDVCGGTCNTTTIIVGNGNNVNNEVICPPPPPPTCEETGTCPPPPPPKHWVEISCTGFEEISGGGSFLVDCAVSDDNGAPISLQAHSNDGNSRVSGINCYSNGGSQTCPSGGTFEFRVSGINSGSSILYSSITATASANGVNATFTSDPFPVDPEDGGF